MKKIFTLIAMALMAVGANAQGSWVAPEEAPAAGATIIKNDALIKVSTVFEAVCGTIKDADGNPMTVDIDGKKFNTFFQVRVDAAPSADDVTGSQHANGTPLVIKALDNADITFFYRRQYANGEVVSNDGKDCKLVDQEAPTAPVASSDFKFFDIDGAYAYAVKKYSLEKGKTYTFFARGTTLSLYGIDWAAGSGQQGGGGSSIADGTYFISYNIEPALSNVTTAEMTNTGTANNCATWEDGFSVMIMRSDKGMSSAKSITIDGNQYTTIKVSNGAQNKLKLPEGKIAESITLYSYVNKDAATERDSYWKEIAGKTFETPADAGGIFANYGENEGTPDMREYSFDGAKLNAITFTNTGEQCCYVIKVTIATGSESTGIQTVKAETIDVNAPIYNLAGQQVDKNFKGVVIQNGKKMIQK